MPMELKGERMPQLQVEGIAKKYKKHQVLKEISFTAKPGEQVVIVGRNGCGKSTLLQILAGVLPADKGEITYYGNKMGKCAGKYRKYCGYVPQENPLLEELTVRDNLRLWAAGNKTYTAEIVRLLQLEALQGTIAGKLSGGMKRRVSIACALLSWPPILLMDEPTTALDVYYKETILDWLKSYRDRNGIVVMTSHDEREIQSADHIYYMEEGILKEVNSSDPLEEIREYMREQGDKLWR